uniref:NADH dehydrogenase [ubiquinone] 1 beta subcomplex subunit 3 n=1 Tax=Cacopsylla melanoneura TaxID=428564 RepID=A0A8D8QLZ6_9HEMI
MGGHGHHFEPPFKVPDWKKMKVENCPQLQNVERALAAKGLKDPWLRNYVWRFPPELHSNMVVRMKDHFTIGMRTGFILCAVTLAAEYTYKFFVPPKDHHHNHDEHH